MEFVKKYWIWILVAVVLLYIVSKKDRNPLKSLLGGSDSFAGKKREHGHGGRKHNMKNAMGEKRFPRHEVVTNREKAIM